jgi:cysteine desulfurase
VIQPHAAAAELVHAAQGFMVCDAVQAVGRISCDFDSLGADAIVLSGHKFGGPKGAGALCLRSGFDIADPLLRGGGQERGRRAGTENVAAIAGLGAAAQRVTELRGDMPRLAKLRAEAEAWVRQVAPDAVMFGATAPRLSSTSCFAVPGLEAQLLLMGLDMEGVAVSSGAACSSGKVRRSHVLEAMGVGADLSKGAIRVSFGWKSAAADVEAFGAAFDRVVRQIQARRLSRAA